MEGEGRAWLEAGDSVAVRQRQRRLPAQGRWHPGGCCMWEAIRSKLLSGRFNWCGSQQATPRPAISETHEMMRFRSVAEVKWPTALCCTLVGL